MYPTLISVGNFRIGSFGLFLVLAFIAGSFVIWKKGGEEHFEEESIFDAILLSTFWGLMGARLGYVFLNWNDFGFNFVKIVALTRYSGLSFMVGAIVAIFVLVFMAHKRKWNEFKVLDIFAQGIVLASILGLVGSFLNGSGYGVQTGSFLGVNFIGVEGLRYPVQLYAAVAYSGLFVLLGKIFAKYRTFEWYRGEVSTAQSGLVFWVWMLGWGLVTALIALIKPSKQYFLSYSLEGWLGVVLVFVSLVGGYRRSGRVFNDDLKALKSHIKGAVKRARGIKIEKKSKVIRKRKRRNRGITAGMDVK